MRTIYRFILPALLAIGTLTPARAQFILTIDLGQTELQPDSAGQSVPFYVRNIGTTDFIAQGATLSFEVDNGDVAVNTAPLITGLNLIAGTPWANTASPAQTPPTGLNTEFASSSVLDFAGSGVTLAAGSSTMLGTVTFNTTGLSSGTWAFRMAQFDTGKQDSKYAEFGTLADVFPTVTNGQLTIVPEPQTFGLIAGLGLLAWATVRRWRELRIDVAVAGPERGN